MAALVAFTVVPLQFWRALKVPWWAWLAYAAWAIPMTVLVGFKSTNEFLRPVFPIVWVTMFVALLPDYMVEKVQRDRQNNRGKATDQTLTLVAHGILDAMRKAGESEEDMRVVLDAMPISPEARDSLLKFQMMAPYLPTPKAPRKSPSRRPAK